MSGLCSHISCFCESSFTVVTTEFFVIKKTGYFYLILRKWNPSFTTYNHRMNVEKYYNRNSYHGLRGSLIDKKVITTDID